MNLYLISDPLVINFYFQKSSVKMAELYQTCKGYNDGSH